MERLLFEKTGDAVYLSHLDLMRVFQRAFQRAELMLWHSQGFTPRAYVSIPLPLSVGTESRCELLEFEMQDGATDLSALPERLNRTLPAGIRVLRAYESSVKMKYLARLQVRLTLEYDHGVPANAARTLAALFARQELLVKKRTKSGGEAEVDIKPMLYAVELQQTSQQELALTAMVSAQNPSCNPQLLVQAIERYAPEAVPDFVRIERLEVYDAQGEIFR